MVRSTTVVALLLASLLSSTSFAAEGGTGLYSQRGAPLRRVGRTPAADETLASLQAAAQTDAAARSAALFETARVEPATEAVATDETNAVDAATEMQPGEETQPQPPWQDNGKRADANGTPAGAANSSGFDPSLVRAGETAFNSSCTDCHDAQKSFQATKSLAAWRTTVRRMADKDGAHVPQNTWEAIATFLASRSSAATGGGGAEASSPYSLTCTVAPTWRGVNDNLQDPGFFGDVWVGVARQGSGPITARATACISCHSQANQYGRVDLVEAVVRLDVTKWLCSECENQPHSQAPLGDLAVEAGRFVVPFGAYYQKVNPGVDRTVTKPLIYNMGQRVYSDQLGDSVLPMPYSDSGAAVNYNLPLTDTTNATFNTYLVNGLQGNAFGIDFIQSRDYIDNNKVPAVGGRVTIGGKRLRLGASVMGGRFNPDGGFGGTGPTMRYTIFGADLTYRYEDCLRIQCEFAQRNSDRQGDDPNTTFQERVAGGYLEGEAMINRHLRVSLLARYDVQSRESQLPPIGSQLPSGDFSVHRFTYGLNWALAGNSLLMINHEHWFLPNDLHSADVVGVRWAVTF